MDNCIISVVGHGKLECNADTLFIYEINCIEYFTYYDGTDSNDCKKADFELKYKLLKSQTGTDLESIRNEAGSSL